MLPIAQNDALASAPPRRDEHARLWQEPAYDRLECLTARFVRHRYDLHSHETYALGVITWGAERYRLRGASRVASAGQVVAVDPGEAHDGEPAAEGYAYRMAYPSLGLMRGVAEEMTGRPCGGTPSLPGEPIDDPDLFRALHDLHVRLERGADRLATDQALVAVLARLLHRHADLKARPVAEGRGDGLTARARACLDADLDRDLDLAAVAEAAGCSRFHLIRMFARATGQTPFGYRVDRRIAAARAALARGERPCEVAPACGFADQSHLTRAFKRRVGVTPAAYRQAHGHR
ncbi:AraC family transcriptional regulator [Marinivivus vitaminiproducens]|uniref:AraC family transcriptional regulator n=1 Tax=Marinivivus vitaminiproducens TaxID=3035935 RepID=UPI0027A41153|nr:AraC family transcriptional regulator [Geminicoccaceae bacterium SCSIO 64248]